MKDIELPPLPESCQNGNQTTDYFGKLFEYTRQDMRSYASAAVEADRAQRVPDGLTLAVIGHKHFGNPIPREWYAAAKELLASTPAQPAQQEPRIPAEFDVRSILLSISPGEDGMGHEVYAASVADVEGLLTSMRQELEEWQLGIRRLPTAARQEPPQQERKPMTDEQAVKCIEAAGFKTWTSAHFRLVKQAEIHHGIRE